MPIRMLRNRIAHHEPVIDWDLSKHYRNIIELSGWLCPSAADWCETLKIYLNRHRQRTHEVAEVVGKHLELRGHGIGGEGPAGQPPAST
jgi:hypothetical protein